MPNKKQPGAHGRWCGHIKSHGALSCNNPSPTGRICVRPRASFIRPRVSALVGNNTHTHTRPASLTASCVFPRATGLCLSQLVVHHSLIRVKLGTTTPPRRSWPAAAIVKPCSCLVFQGYRGTFAMSVGRGRAFWARDGCAHAHARTHTPARADRVPTIWEETLSWCG